MPKSENRNELFVGLFMFVGLVLLGGLIMQFGKFKEHFGGNYQFTVVFDDASGLIKGSEVRLGGARIGRVASLPELTEAVQVEVIIAVDEGVRIPAGSTFQINSATLLGDKLVVVTPPAVMTGLFIEPGSRLMGGGPSGLDALQLNAETVSQDVLRILKESEVTLRKVDGAVVEIQSASKELGEALAKINRTVLAEKNLAHFDTTLANLAEVSGQWKQTSTKLDPTLDDARDAIAALKSAAARTEKTLATADDAMSSIKPAVRNFSLTAEKANEALDRMKRGEGMLGAFASDNEVAFDFKAFMKNLRRHGVLRYRNDAGGTAEPVEALRSKIKGRPN